MKQLTIYINEKLVLNKDTFKGPVYKYSPKTRDELQKAIAEIYKNSEDKSILDLRSIDVSEIDNMYDLFNIYDYNCPPGIKTVKVIDISGWNTSNVENMSNMFCYFRELKEIKGIDELDVSNVEEMLSMFMACNNLTKLDLSSWNLASCKTISYMFEDCLKLQSAGKLDNWMPMIKRNKINMRRLFKECNSLHIAGRKKILEYSKMS